MGRHRTNRACRPSEPGQGPPRSRKWRSMEIFTGLTFDDVLLVPGASDILPSDAILQTQLNSEISLNIPILSSATDPVTEADMASLMAKTGGNGVATHHLTEQEKK